MAVELYRASLQYNMIMCFVLCEQDFETCNMAYNIKGFISYFIVNIKLRLCIWTN
jgi:hypothetical protein